jgi:RNA polymerase sigma-70 factor (ECF subfamily)
VSAPQKSQTSEVQLVKIENRTEFLRLTEQYMDQLYSVAVGMTRDHYLAQDLVQETYLKAFKSFSNLNDHSNIKAWLFRILTNSYISLYRKKKVRPQEQKFDETFQAPASKSWEPEEVFNQSFGNEDLRKAIDDLPEANRLVVLMVDAEGFSYKETAEILDIPIGTVMSRLNRGRTALQNALISYRHAML